MSARGPLLAGIILLVLAVLATALTLGGRPARSGTPPADESKAADQSLSARVPAGQVASVLRFGRTEGVGGAIRPGDTIDVYAFFPGRASDAPPATRVLLRERLVYGTAPDADGTSVTLAMTPEEAILVQNALLVGARPYAALRSARGIGTGAAPATFDDEALASWITGQGAGIASPGDAPAGGR